MKCLEAEQYKYGSVCQSPSTLEIQQPIPTTKYLDIHEFVANAMRAFKIFLVDWKWKWGEISTPAFLLGRTIMELRIIVNGPIVFVVSHIETKQIDNWADHNCPFSCNDSLGLVLHARSQSTVPLSTTHLGWEPHGTYRGAWPIATLARQ